MSYDIVINRRREKLMLEMLFIKKDAYEGWDIQENSKRS
jgi:hypothetical protein